MVRCTDRPDMTIAIDWDVKHQTKQTNKTSGAISLVTIRLVLQLVKIVYIENLISARVLFNHIKQVKKKKR